MAKVQINILKKNGQYLLRGLNNIIDEYNLPIKTEGVETVIYLKFAGQHRQTLKTYFTQEMLKRGFLASNLIYLSIAHQPEVINKYLIAVTEVAEKLRHIINESAYESILDGPISHEGFERLN